MSTNIRLEKVIFELAKVTPDEFGDCLPLLYTLLNDFQTIPNRHLAIPAMFAIIERYPDADLGSPGPLVHEIEAIGGYELLLEASLNKSPTALGCWMANRIINITQEYTGRRRWLNFLSKIAADPSSPNSARLEARDFLANSRRV